MDVTTLTVEQLKSMAYDQYAILEHAQNNLRILNGEIIKRATPAKVEPTGSTEKE